MRLLLIALLFAFVGCAKVASENETIVLPDDFGAKALFRVTELCKLGSRNSLKEGAKNAAKWIKEELETAGLSAKICEFDDGNFGIFRNIIATIPGSGKGELLLISHYDTKSGIDDFVGANDGGSSTGFLIELAAFLKDKKLSQTITFAFVDGEECFYNYTKNDGLIGSRYLANIYSNAGKRFDAVVVFDMIGDKDLTITMPRNGDQKLQMLLLESAKANSVRDKIEVTGVDILDDHVPFIEKGYPAIDIIDFHYGSQPGLNNYWHTSEDTPDKLSAESLQIVAKLFIGIMERL